MLVTPATDSTSSGMCVRPIDPDASISSITFGFTSAAAVVTIGVLEMSVGPPSEAVATVIATTAAKAWAAGRRDANPKWACFMVSLFRRAAPLLQENLRVADCVARADHL